MLMFVGAEAMLFSGLITAFLVYRLGSPLWPPLGEPRLPIAVTGVNTVVLLLSAATMHRARQRASRGRLAVTAVLGAAFLVVQGGEWARLLAWGLTAASSPYGGIFYLLIGTHGVHVLAAVVTLAVLTAATRRLTAARLEAVSLYWYFVCGVWVVLFPLVYL
jgi:heme/copper-type cytochrome/quinol oxidase subunit 3